MKNIPKHKQLNKQLRVFLYTYNSIVNSVIHGVKQQEKDSVICDVLPLMIQSVGSSSHTIYKITDAEELTIKDAYLVMRCVIETTINTCLIIVDSSYAEKAHRHALQKTARFMKRENKVGSYIFKMEFSEYEKFAQRADVRNALEEYCERDNWINESLIKKLEVLEEYIGPCAQLSGAFNSMHREAAELMHGSYFGIINFYGFNKGNQNDLEIKLLSIQTEILFYCISCLHKIIELCAKKYSLEREFKLSDELFGSVIEKTRYMIEAET